MQLFIKKNSFKTTVGRKNALPVKKYCWNIWQTFVMDEILIDALHFPDILDNRKNMKVHNYDKITYRYVGTDLMVTKNKSWKLHKKLCQTLMNALCWHNFSKKWPELWPRRSASPGSRELIPLPYIWTERVAFLSAWSHSEKSVINK
jgi:hypothetical protein